MLDELGAAVHARIGDWIFGVDEVSQADAIKAELKRLGWQLAIAAQGFGGQLKALLDELGAGLIEVDASEVRAPEDLQAIAGELSKAGKTVGLAAAFDRDLEGQELSIAMAAEGKERKHQLAFGGPIDSAPVWASKIVVERLRRFLLKQNP